MRWLIKRLEDGRFYAGTADRKPVFSDKKHAAQFKKAQAAETRAQGLGGKDYEAKFEVVPG